MYVYVFIHIYICICVYIHIYVYIYTHIVYALYVQAVGVCNNKQYIISVHSTIKPPVRRHTNSNIYAICLNPVGT